MNDTNPGITGGWSTSNQKSEEDFADVAERINEALMKIASDPKLKADRLAEIERAKSYGAGPDKEEKLSEQVEKAHLETQYCFNKYHDALALHGGLLRTSSFLQEPKTNIGKRSLIWSSSWQILSMKMSGSVIF